MTETLAKALPILLMALVLAAGLGGAAAHADDKRSWGLGDARGQPPRAQAPIGHGWGHHMPPVQGWDGGDRRKFDPQRQIHVQNPPQRHIQTPPHHVPSSPWHRWDGQRQPHHYFYPPHGHVVGTLPAKYYLLHHHGVPFYYSAGVWYRPWGPRFVAVAPPFGLVVRVLPPVYTTVWIHSVPYYYANNVYYVPTPQGYVVTPPPTGDVITEEPATNAGAESSGESVTEQPSTAPSTDNAPPANQSLYIYPRQGQDQWQQNKDRSECRDWAVGQTGYDPNVASNSADAPEKYSDYLRAMSACLEGRGYTVR